MLQAVQYSANQEMEHVEDLVMRCLIVTQMELANNIVQYEDQKATESVEDHALRVEYASVMVLVKFQVQFVQYEDQKATE